MVKEQMKTLNSQIEKFNSNIIKTKDRKFVRDKIAFSTGKAYRWKNEIGYCNRSFRFSMYPQSSASETDSDTWLPSLHINAHVKAFLQQVTQEI